MSVTHAYKYRRAIMYIVTFCMITLAIFAASFFSGSNDTEVRYIVHIDKDAKKYNTKIAYFLFYVDVHGRRIIICPNGKTPKYTYFGVSTVYNILPPISFCTAYVPDKIEQSLSRDFKDYSSVNPNAFANFRIDKSIAQLYIAHKLIGDRTFYNDPQKYDDWFFSVFEFSKMNKLSNGVYIINTSELENSTDQIILSEHAEVQRMIRNYYDASGSFLGDRK